MSEKYILAGDIGGTKTILALFSKTKGPYFPVFEKVLVSAEIKDFVSVVKDFLLEKNIQPEVCCFGVAGPIFNGNVKITKLGWHLSEKKLQSDLGVHSVTLLNDLVATAYALPVLHNTDVCILNQGERDTYGAKVIIAPGTGLGEVFLTHEHGEYKAHPSEGGHCLFAPATKCHHELLQFLNQDQEQITYDLLCSGRGIPLIYSFLKHKKNVIEPPWLSAKINKSADPTPHIIESAFMSDESAQISIQALDIFLEILASEAANCALKILSTGGVYLAGGIPPRLLDMLKKKSFLECFSSRKPFQTFLSKLPVTIITNPKSALIGAAYHGMKQVEWG